MDNVREDLTEKNIDFTRVGEATRNREVWRSLVGASPPFRQRRTLTEERKEERVHSQYVIPRITCI